MPVLRKKQGASNNISARLKTMQKRWNDSKEAGKVMFDRIPEGEYIGKLVSCELGFSSNDNMMIKRCHTPIEGEFKGKNCYDSLSIEHDVGLAFCAEWLNTLGIDLPKDVADIEEVIKEVNKNGYECKFKVSHPKNTSFEGINLRVLELTDEGSGSEVLEEEVDLDSMSREELESFIEEQQLDVAISSKMSDKAIRKAIADAFAEEPEAEEAEEPEAEEAEEPGAESITLEQVFEFCEAQGIEYDEDSDDFETITENIQGYEFEEDSLDDEEKELLQTLEIYDEVVVKPEPKKGKKLLKRRK